MKCPHCTISIHEDWFQSGVFSDSGHRSLWRVRIMTCPDCKEEILSLGKGHQFGQQVFDPPYWTQIYPQGSNRGPVSPDVPQGIAADYNEAALVLPYSPKASAALARRCLQAVLWDAGYTQRDLAVQIDAALAETDTRKAIPTGVYSTLDAVRNFGNFSAHVITDQTTLQIIDVQDHEAEFCLDILDAVFDHYYVGPAEAKRRKAALDAKLSAAGKPASK